MSIRLPEELEVEVYRCFRCGYCRAQCPIFKVKQNESWNTRGRMILIRSLIEGNLNASSSVLDRLYCCSLCKACETSCPAVVRLSDVYERVREGLVELKLGPLERHQRIARDILAEGNPFRQPRAERSSSYQCKGPREAEALFFVGCVSAYRKPSIVQSVEKILTSTETDYTTLGAQELCCGSVLMRTGQTRAAEKLARQNTRMFKELGVQKILTVCPGCYLTLKVDYPKLVKDFPFEVVHISEFLSQLLEIGKLQLTKQVGLKVTYHDPCHIGRRFNLYEPPRTVLSSIPGLKLVEMSRSRENAQCCGAGGGVKSAFSDTALKIGVSRMEEAAQTKADLLVTSCPFCCVNLGDASRQAQLLPVSDLTEIVAEAI